MELMKSLILEVSFFEAFFRVHYTKTSPLTYPIPLPTAVAGIFGSMLGIPREKLLQEFSGCLFGAALKNGEYSESGETATYVLHKKRVTGVEKMRMIHEPTYLCAIASTEIEKYKRKIESGIRYLPFGGRNDFFVKDWKIVTEKDFITSEKVSNYLPHGWVGEILPKVRLEVLPVMHRLSEDVNFVFIIDGHVKVKKEFLERMKICEVNGKNIALYSLNEFYGLIS